LRVRPCSGGSPSPSAVYLRIWLCHLRWVVLYIHIYLFIYSGTIGGFFTKRSRAGAQTVSRRSLTTKFRVLFQANPSVIYGGQSGITTGFFSEYFGFPLSVSFN
jgi:hypothetical protein